MSESINNSNGTESTYSGAIFVIAFMITVVIVAVGSNQFHSNNNPSKPLMVARLEATNTLIPTNEAIATVEPTHTPMPTSTPAPTHTPAPTSTPEPTQPPQPTIPPSPTDIPPTTGDDNQQVTTSAYSAEQIARGQELFTTCSACHGANGLGVPNLGKSLVGTEFIHSLTDDELVQFISTGRPIWDASNTTGVDMPPKGGNPMLTSEDILAIVSYIRSLDTENTTANTTPVEQPTEQVVELATTVAGAYTPEQIARGQELFTTCSACHGANALGVPNLGKSLVGTEFIHSLTDDELVQFISTGRPIWDAANTTGVDMPPKGGNPMLTSEDILAIVSYIRSLDTGG
jgi:disulfide bond formation protein DsbB